MSNPFTLEDITLYHGDCREILPTLDRKANAVITDPPYGISFRSNMRAATPKFDPIKDDHEPTTEWLSLLDLVVQAESCLFMFTHWTVERGWQEAVEEAGWNIKNQVIWYKPGGGMGDLYSQFAPTHENAVFAIRGEWKFPGRRPADVYNFTHEYASSYVHPTQKPLALMGKVVLDITRAGDLVIDPFFGSCSTGVACAKYGRKFIGIETDEEYFKKGCDAIAQELERPLLF